MEGWMNEAHAENLLHVQYHYDTLIGTLTRCQWEWKLVITLLQSA